MSLLQHCSKQLSCAPIRRIGLDASSRPFRYLHASATNLYPRKRLFFSSNAALQQEAPVAKSGSLADYTGSPKRKNIRSPAGKTSLRRVAAEAQRSRESSLPKAEATSTHNGNNRVTAICVAEQFNMDSVSRILQSHGFPINPDGTDFETDQVIHTRGVNNGDVFVFPSGSVVAWSLPEDVAMDLAAKTLLPAAVRPNMDQIELEDFEYVEDRSRDNSSIKGDIITLGTKKEFQEKVGSK